MGLSRKNRSYDEDLRQRVGQDSTSNFESDPEFSDNIPTANASSENLSVSADPDLEADRDDLFLNETLADGDTFADSAAGTLGSMSQGENRSASTRSSGKHKSTRRAA